MLNGGAQRNKLLRGSAFFRGTPLTDINRSKVANESSHSAIDKMYLTTTNWKKYKILLTLREVFRLQAIIRSVYLASLGSFEQFCRILDGFVDNSCPPIAVLPVLVFNTLHKAREKRSTVSSPSASFLGQHILRCLVNFATYAHR